MNRRFGVLFAALLISLSVVRCRPAPASAEGLPDDVTLVSLGSVLPADWPVYRYLAASRLEKLAPEGVLLRRWFTDAWRSLRVG